MEGGQQRVARTMTAVHSLLLTFVAAFGTSLGLTAVVKSLAGLLGILDRPDGHRKLHSRPVPLWGGVGVYLAMVAGLATARWGRLALGPQFDELAWVVAAAAGLVCVVGCIDDAFRLGPRVKLLLQTLSVLPVVLAGYSVQQIIFLGWTIQFGWLGIPITVLWLVGCINALNLLDGMDGLASMVGVFTAATMGLIAAYLGNSYVTVVALALAGALAGFFVHNRPPASIFLGDSGSMVIGMVVGILGIQSTLKTSATLSITAPLVVMTLPVFDTFLAVLRRRLTGRPFDAADRQHIHHRLLDRGMNPWWVLAVLGSLCLVTGVAATVATILRLEMLAWATAVVVIIAAVRLRLFGHYELILMVDAAARLLASLSSRWAAEDALLALNRRLQTLAPGDAWALLIEEVRTWNATQLQVQVARADEISWQKLWVSPRRGSTRPAWWVGVSSESGGPGVCQVCVEGAEAASLDPLSVFRLLRLLRLFAEHFATHIPAVSPETQRRAA